MTDKPYRFAGFAIPTTTSIPDEFFDELMVHLSAAELRVLLYLMRRTFGFKKRADAISLKQIINGITTKDGRRFDHGAGLSHTAVKAGIKGLIEKGVITVSKAQADDGVNETNVYAIVFHGVGNEVAYGGQPRGPRVGNEVAPQQTVQQTDPNGEEFKMGMTLEEHAAWMQRRKRWRGDA